MTLIALVSALTGTARAQDDLLLYAADQFGEVNKGRPESTIHQQQLEVMISAQKGAFEPLGRFEESDRFRQLGRSVGMLDLLVKTRSGRRGNATCTATLIAPDRILTNYHCVPGFPESARTVRAQLRLGYLDRLGANGDVYTVDVDPIEANRKLDYAILKVKGVPTDRYPPIPVRTEKPRDRQSLYLLHHPNAEPLRLSRFRCQAANPAIAEDGHLVHLCDTIAGSSGALLLSSNGDAIVGLHHSGVADSQGRHNLATPIEQVLATSEELRRAAQRAPERPPPTPASGLGAKLWRGLTYTKNQCPGTYDYFPGGGMRIFACHAASHVDYTGLVAAFGASPFLRGPHTPAQLDLANAGSFGHYNPTFVKWLGTTFLPAVTDPAFRAATQSIYDANVRPLARTYEVVYRKLHAPQNAECTRLEQLYYGFAINDAHNFGKPEATAGYVERWFGYLADAYCAKSSRDQGHLDWDGLPPGFDGNVVKTTVGFWLRRRMDGTAEVWHEQLLKLLRAYDRDWLASL